MITLIWAQTKKRIIGSNGLIPWSIKSEMRFFKEQTLNKTVVMGRKTWDSLKIKPLPNRKNVVISKNKFLNLPKDVLLVNNLDEYLQKISKSNQEYMIIGGSFIYKSAINFANKLIVSIINYDCKGDIFAPIIDTDFFYLEQSQNYEEFQVNVYVRKTNDK